MRPLMLQLMRVLKLHYFTARHLVWGSPTLFSIFRAFVAATSHSVYSRILHWYHTHPLRRHIIPLLLVVYYFDVFNSSEIESLNQSHNSFDDCIENFSVSES